MSPGSITMLMPLAIIEAVLEVIVEILLELVLQVVGELLAEFGVRGFGKLTSRKSNPVVAAIGYAILGGLLGWASVWLWPQAMLSQELRIAQLVGGPLLAGAMMAVVGALVRRRGLESIRLESFFFGWLLAFSLSLVRFLLA